MKKKKSLISYKAYPENYLEPNLVMGKPVKKFQGTCCQISAFAIITTFPRKTKHLPNNGPLPPPGCPMTSIASLLGVMLGGAGKRENEPCAHGGFKRSS